MSDPRYPIGKFSFEPFPDSAARAAVIADIRNLPAQLRATLVRFDEDSLDTAYREGGWSVRQLVHHIADSHMNAFIRFRLGLTEERPTVKPYDEAAWAKLPDAKLSIDSSLAILDNVHHRWAMMLENTDEAEFAREIIHPESGVLSLDKLLQLYSWHGRHHLAHIQNAPPTTDHSQLS